MIFPIVLNLATLLAGPSVWASPQIAPTGDPLGHSLRGHAFDSGPRTLAQLLPGMPKISFSTSAKNAKARSMILQGLGQLHGFMGFEAERSFRTAEKFEPGCVFAYAGMALANSIFYMGSSKRAYAFLTEGRKVLIQRKSNSPCAGALELGIFEALEKFYQPTVNPQSPIESNGLPKVDFSKTDRQTLIDSLSSLADRYPSETEPRAFEALFRLMSNSTFYVDSTQSGDNVKPLVPYRVLTRETKSRNPILQEIDTGEFYKIENALDQVFQLNPLHPAHHYRIHLYDEHYVRSEKKPEEWIRAFEPTAIRSASLNGGSGPGVPHQWHMAAHIYRHGDVSWTGPRLWTMEAGMRTEYSLLSRTHETPLEIHNFWHHNDFWLDVLRSHGFASKIATVALDLTRLPIKSKAATGNADLDLGGGLELYVKGLSMLLELASSGVTTNGELLQIIEIPSEPILRRAESQLVLASALLRAGNQDQKVTQLLSMIQEAFKAKTNNNWSRVFARQLLALHQALLSPTPMKSVLEWFETNRSILVSNGLQGLPLLALARLTEQGIGTFDELIKLANQNYGSQATLAGIQAFVLLGKLEHLASTPNQKSLLRETRQKLVQKDFPLSTSLIVKLDPDSIEGKALQSSGLIKTPYEYPSGFEEEIAPRPRLTSLGPITYQRAKVARSYLRWMKIERPTLIVFELGKECSRCAGQAATILSKADQLTQQGVDILFVSPVGRTAMEVPLSNDRIRSMSMDDPNLKGFGMLDEFENITRDGGKSGPLVLHGLFLVDTDGRVLWKDIASQPYDDIAGLWLEIPRQVRIGAQLSEERR